jgi:hypothetical protein
MKKLTLSTAQDLIFLTIKHLILLAIKQISPAVIMLKCAAAREYAGLALPGLKEAE